MKTATAGQPARDNPKPQPFVEKFGDILLRSAGFQIVSRPKTGPAVWKRNDKLADETLALALAGREQDQLKQALDEQANS